MTNDYLVGHAVKHAWCSPRQDLQVILQPARISFPGGARRSVDHSWSTIPLPTPQDLYHVYQIGQVNPAALGLTPGRMVWRNITDVMNNEMLIADLYVNNGLHLNRSECWVVYTEERNLLLAVKDQPKIANLVTEPLYFRLYSNAYFDSVRSRGETQAIITRSITVENAPHALALQNEYRSRKELHGLTLLYHNGAVVDDILPNRVSVGDVLEYVYDSSVKQVVELKIKDLLYFNSVLDAKAKYLLHYPQAQVKGEMIDYRDDIDVYLVRQYVRGNITNAFEGVYFHKNANDAFRQLTHRDYSLAVPYVNGYVQSRAGWTAASELTVRLHIRDGGYARPLIHEHSRIRELYKLPERELVQAMHGTESSVDVWKAVNLENSDYIRVMDALYPQITRELVQSAYGYNAVSLLAGNSPLQVRNVQGRRQVSLPYGLQSDSTMYEYDAQGVLLGHYIHTDGPEYVPQNRTCELVEGIVGRGSYKTSTVFNFQDVVINPRYNYRFYVCPRKVGLPDHTRWEDVTGDETKYMIVDGHVTWFVDPLRWFVAVRSDEQFLAYSRDLTSTNGLLRFSIDGDSTYPDGIEHGIFYIPVGKFDLWLNGRAMIEGLDYVIRWPEIVVCNKRYLVPGKTQRVTVRGTGFCNKDLSRRPPAENGFVNHGMLSRNRRYDIRDDKVQRIVIDGRTYHRSVLKFAEEHQGIQVSAQPEGSPYIVENIIVPLRELGNDDDYGFLKRSEDVDQAVSDYLTSRLPEPTIEEPVLVPHQKYAIYSPFSSTIMHDLINGVLSTADFQGYYSDRQLRAVLAQYEPLLPYDPVFRDGLDLRYVSIHPHNLLTEVELDIYQWRMLSRAIRIYLQERVDLSQFVSVKKTLI
jgi:hypothetical protein